MELAFILALNDKLFFEFDIVTALMVKRAYKGLPAIAPSNVKVSGEEITLLGEFDNYILKFKKLVEKEKRSDGTYRQWKSTRKKVLEFLSYKYNL